MTILSAQEFLNKDIHNNLKDQIDHLSAEAFGHETVYPTVETAIQVNAFIGYLEMDGQVVSSGFGKEDTYDQSSRYKTIYIHTFSTKQEYRGKGLCKKIVSEFIKKFGNTHILYLTVRTESGHVNESAIKCYERSGFILLPAVYRDHYDGKNNAMIRVPTTKKTTTTTTRRKKKKSRRR